MSPPRGATSAGAQHLTAENSNSSWAELRPQLIGTFQMYPATSSTQQILLLRYLTPLGEYQEVSRASRVRRPGEARVGAGEPRAESREPRAES